MTLKYTTSTPPSDTLLSIFARALGLIISALVCLALLSRPSIASQAEDTRLSILVTNHVLEKYPIYLDGRDVTKITDYKGKEAHREVLELVLLYQALYFGGYRGNIKLIASSWDYHQRLLTLKRGRITLLAQSAWHEDLHLLSDKIIISDPIIPRGHFEAGLFTLPSNKKALSARTLKDIQQLNGVSNQQWSVDWKTLSSLNLKHLYHANYWGGMIKMVTARRADFLLAPIISIEPAEIEGSGFFLQPIPGVKVLLDGSRHWAISRKHPRSKIAQAALHQGMKQMRQEGRFLKAFKDIDLINTNVQHWTVINENLLEQPIKPQARN